jgi:hypothetical protein
MEIKGKLYKKKVSKKKKLLEYTTKCTKLNLATVLRTLLIRRYGYGFYRRKLGLETHVK